MEMAPKKSKMGKKDDWASDDDMPIVDIAKVDDMNGKTGNKSKKKRDKKNNMDNYFDEEVELQNGKNSKKKLSSKKGKKGAKDDWESDDDQKNIFDMKKAPVEEVEDTVMQNAKSKKKKDKKKLIDVNMDNDLDADVEEHNGCSPTDDISNMKNTNSKKKLPSKKGKKGAKDDWESDDDQNNIFDMNEAPVEEVEDTVVQNAKSKKKKDKKKLIDVNMDDDLDADVEELNGCSPTDDISNMKNTNSKKDTSNLFRFLLRPSGMCSCHLRCRVRAQEYLSQWLLL